MADSWESLVRVARWAKNQGKRNVIADLEPLCDITAELDRLRAVNAVLVDSVKGYRAQHDRIRWEHMRPCDCAECKIGCAALAAAAEPTASPSGGTNPVAVEAPAWPVDNTVPPLP